MMCEEIEVSRESVTSFMSGSAGCVLDLELYHFRGGAFVAIAATAFRTADGGVGGGVVLVRRDQVAGEGEYTMRFVNEIAGPPACYCPDRILDRLSPTKDRNANHWRDGCREGLGWIGPIT